MKRIKAVKIRPQGKIEIIQGEKWWFANVPVKMNPIRLEYGSELIAYKLLNPKEKYINRIKK
jgi:hypothetical protein